MASSLFFVLFTLTVCELILGVAAYEKPGSSHHKLKLADWLVAAGTTFSLKLYNKLKDQHSNMAFSGYSIHSALTMAYVGARGSTEEQMMRTLDLKELRKKNTRCVAYAPLVRLLTESGSATLDVAFAAYVKRGPTIKQKFSSCLQDTYKTKFDFLAAYQAGGSPEAPINSWVAEKTENKITDMLAPNMVTAQTSMILINAIYFKANWKNQFDASKTSLQPFHRDDGSQITVEMMNRISSHKYSQHSDLLAHIVELPYHPDGRFSMYILLPKKRNGLADVERQLTQQRLHHALQSMYTSTVDLYLPKFKGESEFNLKETLEEMGMTVPFSSSADFTDISPAPLHLSDVVHKAVIEVNENGTEAAAATGVLTQSSLRFKISFKADHPFLYLIRDSVSKAVLFMGKYSGQ